MAGYVIHISVGMEYLRKHHDCFNQEEFIEGIIAPDDVKDKSLTHYGISSSKPNLKQYILEHPLMNSFDYGYFLHLVTDYLFYNFYIDTFSKQIYQDYDLLNRRLIEKYQIELPQRIQHKVFYKEEGTLQILNYDLVCQIINEISSLNLDNIIVEIQNDSGKWKEFRELKRID